MDMINCTVETNRLGHLTVTFDDKRTIYLQSENERAQFGVACGIIEAPTDWIGVSYHLTAGWWEKDFESITECPDYYINSAE